MPPWFQLTLLAVAFAAAVLLHGWLARRRPLWPSAVVPVLLLSGGAVLAAQDLLPVPETILLGLTVVTLLAWTGSLRRDPHHADRDGSDA